MPEDAGTRSNLRERLGKHLKEPSIIFKVVQLILCIISVGLIVEPFNKILQRDINIVALVFTSVCSFIYINLIIILQHTYHQERLPKYTARNFAIVGGILCCAAGAMVINDWKSFSQNYIARTMQEELNQMVASGVFAILASIVFFVEAYILNKND
ncbi:uncharacterized protein [Prorops nasuta]|uniref:uncharacterized protein n=1 Tax=Prorops nasuta TaxID=863751 RepID=UPI0034CE5BFE